MRWFETDKGDPRCRALVDRHYTRQTVGHPLWTRPGYNFSLYTESLKGSAVFNWWRPKWEADVQRQDGLMAIECTIFRNETGWLSSVLIAEAVAAVQTWGRYEDGTTLITAVQSKKTTKGRSRASPPGACFVHAGWEVFDHVGGGKPDVWLRCAHLANPIAPRLERRGQMVFIYPASHPLASRH